MAVLSLASFIQAQGHQVRIHERNLDDISLSRVLNEFRPEVVVFTLMFAQQLADMQNAHKQLRAERPELPVLCGGQMASLIPELLLREGLTDYVGIGEGEYTLLELLEVIEGRREPATVQSLVYLDANGAPVHTPLRPFADLSEFPDTDFTLLPTEKYDISLPGDLNRGLTVYASKGCPSKCTFCYNAAYHRCQYRLRPRESVMREIEALVTTYNAEGIIFVDDLWGLRKEDLRAYCDFFVALSARLGRTIWWACETRIGVLSREDLRHMADAGCKAIMIGLESGSPEVLKRIKKGYPLNRVVSDFENCATAGIATMADAIFGIPGETPTQIKQTIHTIFRLNPTIYAVGMFIATPGSEEYSKLATAGKLTPPATISDWADFGERFFLGGNYSAIPNRELNVIHSFFLWRQLFQNRKDGRTGRLDIFKYGLRRVLDGIGHKGYLAHFAKFLRLLLVVVWYSHAYPGIKKKYDLSARNFGRKDWDDLAHLDT